MIFLPKGLHSFGAIQTVMPFNLISTQLMAVKLIRVVKPVRKYRKGMVNED